MKKALITLLLIAMIAGGVGGTWYYMNMQLQAKTTELEGASAELATAKTQLSAAQAEVQAQSAAKIQEQEMLAAYEAWMLSSGSGVDLTALENYYAESALFEGSLSGVSLRSYTLALQKYNKTLAANEGVKAVPLKFKGDDWSVVVALKEKNIQAPLVLNQSGSVVRAPAKIGQELVLILSKWQDGKIVEQYEFPYLGDASKSHLLSYIGAGETQSGATMNSKIMQGASETTDTPVSVEEDIIPAESNMVQSGATSASGTAR